MSAVSLEVEDTLGHLEVALRATLDALPADDERRTRLQAALKATEELYADSSDDPARGAG